MKRTFLVMAGLSFTLAADARDHSIHSFKKQVLTDQFWGEGASVGDFNRDRKTDVVSGPFWYQGPDFKQRHEYYPATEKFKKKNADGSEQEIPGFEGALGVNNAYSRNFIAHTHDFNADGWQDILILGFPGDTSSWYENPKGKPGHWPRHTAVEVTDNESPTFGDLTGDGQPEIICSSKGALGYATYDPKNPTALWKWHNISPNNNYHKFSHGLGFGDVNGDRRADILEKDGWWEQPAVLDNDPLWKQHKYPFAPGMGGSQMYAYDVNGDGLNDVITAFAAHAFGLSWHEQLATKNEGEISFREHIILNKQAIQNEYGVSFSQLHAVDLVDMDGDGLKDLVTGKRFWAHGSAGDPEPNAAAVLYWFKLERTGSSSRPDDASLNGAAGANSKGAHFVPYKIDDDSGVGTQVLAADINGDKLPDIIVGNKKGTFVHNHSKKKGSRKDWEAVQPKKVGSAQGGK